MYIKLFESPKSSNSYIVRHDISLKGLNHGAIYIENQDKVRLKIDEDELFQLINLYFKIKTKKSDENK